MKRKHYTLVFLLLSMMVALPAFSQRQKENYHENQNPFGKKKKEKRNQSKALSKRGGGGLFKKKHSAGNADNFASNRISGGRGFFYKMFHGNHSGSKNASLRKTKPGKVQDKENSRLFKRNRTSTKKRNSGFLNKQNKDRSSRRTRGNSVFHKKKH
jgi:hypothetical protein